MSAPAGFDDLTPNLSDAEKVWRCRTCGIEQDSSGPIVAAPPAPSEAAIEAGMVATRRPRGGGYFCQHLDLIAPGVASCPLESYRPQTEAALVAAYAAQFGAAPEGPTP